MHRLGPLAPALLAATLTGLVAAGLWLPPTPEAPSGILSLEVAWSEQQAHAIVAGWVREDWLGRAKAMQVADCVFPFVYGAATAAVAVRWGRTDWRLPAVVGAVAAALDVFVENPILDLLIWGSEVNDTLIHVATVAAVVKFGLLAVALPLMVVGPRRA